jgi:uncharacterized protein with beta-barrel porin domain
LFKILKTLILCLISFEVLAVSYTDPLTIPLTISGSTNDTVTSSVTNSVSSGSVITVTGTGTTTTTLNSSTVTNVTGIVLLNTAAGNVFSASTATTNTINFIGNSTVSGAINIVAPATLILNFNSTSDINLNGNITLASGSTMNFNNGSNKVLITGAIAGNGSSLIIGPVSAGNFTAPSTQAMTGFTTITATNGSFTTSLAITGITTLSSGAAGILNVGHALNPLNFTNAGVLNLSASGNVNSSGAGSFSNTGTIFLDTVANFDATSFTASSVNGTTGKINIGNSNFTAGGVYVNNGSMFVYNDSTISGALVGGASSSLNFGIDSNGALYPSTVFSTTGTVASTPTVHVYAGTFNAATALAGLTTVTVDSGATANISSSLTGTGAATYVNNGSTTLQTGGSFTGFTTYTNASNTTLTGDTDFGSLTFNNSGSLTVSGTRTLAHVTLNNTGIVSVAVQNATTADEFICGTGCTANFTGGKFVVTSSFVGSSNVVYSWNLISAGASVTGLTSSNVYLPNTLFDKWSITTLTSSLLTISTISLQPTPLTSVLSPALDLLFSSFSLNSQQTLLVNTLNGLSNNATQLNGALKQLIPNINATAPLVTTQKAIFSKIEDRIAALRNQNDKGHLKGFTAGDLNPNVAVWVGGFGSRAKQRQIELNTGYSAKTGGVLIGVDRRNSRKNIVGVAIGSSTTHVLEALNENFNTKIESYHAMIYGTNIYKRGNFYEWLVTAAYNQHKSSRPILLGSTSFATYAAYHTASSAAKINIGSDFPFEDILVITPSVFGQYSLTHQPTYNEHGSAAALSVTPGKNLNTLLSVGTGLKIASSSESWRWLGSREIRALLSYDLVNPTQVVSANFIAGSPSFFITNKQDRLSLKLGADFTYDFLDSLQLQLSYDYEMRYRYRDHTGALKFKYLF